MNRSTEITRPLVRYHAGKWRLAPWILEFFPRHQSYVEPFGGGANLLLQKARCATEVYNDLDSDMGNVFAMLREHGDQLAKLIRLTPYSREEHQLSLRKAKDRLERARRTLVRAGMAFGDALDPLDGPGSAMCHEWAEYPGVIRAVASRLAGVVVEKREPALVMRHHDGPTTLHDVDPPRPQKKTPLAREGKAYKYEMTFDSHRELAATLNSLKGYVVLSGHRSALQNDLYSGWTCMRSAPLTDAQKAKPEQIWINPACAAALKAERIQLDLLEVIA